MAEPLSNSIQAIPANPPLGFIATDIHFPRPPGDPFHEQTWPFPLIREQARGSTESDIVTGTKYDDAFIERFVEAGKKLADRGCIGIITSCGFLAMAQNELSARIPIPISTSSLLQLPSLLAILPSNKSIGILTYDDARLGPLHLSQLGIDTTKRAIPIRGAPANGHLRRLITEGGPYIHHEIEDELVDVAKRLIAECEESGTEIAGLLLECTQMPPFAEAIQKATGVPVYDVYTMGMWFYSGLATRRPQRWGDKLVQ
ncbi:unnamed protein product [Clonostachys rosea]|uniref:Aspartate/glutamate racemase family protein n=1 Tax=Bionectria ochroleuca TaxID=29856 RepID=A0ABY6UWW4_BIOOC|nr:unnamed protein product [Clonostachys rosea]